MIKYLQLPFQFDAAKMQAEVKQLDNSRWQQHYQKLHYEGEWSAIPLRSVNGQADNIIISPLDNAEYRDTHFLEESNYLKKILAGFHCPLLAVRLLKLNAGAIIKEHRDAELCFEKGEVRLHIPVITHPDLEFYLDKERMILQEGECWYMNFNLPHSISNHSPVNRIHLVIDAVVNDWLTNLFNSDSVRNKKEIADPPAYSPEDRLKIIAALRAMNTDTSNQLAEALEKDQTV